VKTRLCRQRLKEMEGDRASALDSERLHAKLMADWEQPKIRIQEDVRGGMEDMAQRAQARAQFEELQRQQDREGRQQDHERFERGW
jgi:hypothetical protein